MPPEENKALYRRWIQTVFNDKDSSAIDRFLDPALVEHDVPPGFPPNVEGTKQYIEAFLGAFRDLRVNTEDIISEGDKVVARFTLSGTQKGEFLGMPPSGRQFTIRGIDMLRVGGS